MNTVRGQIFSARGCGVMQQTWVAKVLARTLLASCLAAMSGCATLSALNPFAELNDDEIEPAELMDFTSEVEVDRRWQKQIGGGFGKSLAKLEPAAASGYLIAADPFGRVQAFDPASGKVVWESSVGRIKTSLADTAVFWSPGPDREFVTGGVGGDDDLVAIGTEAGEVIAINAGSGDVVWRTELSSEVLAAPAVDADYVAVQTIDGKVYGLARESGDRLWSYDVQVPVLTLRGTSSPVLDNGLVIVGLPNGRVAAIGAAQGNVVWDQRVTLPKGRSELERIVDVDGTPLVSGGMVYAASFQGAIKAMGMQDGRTAWEYEVSTWHQLVRGFGFVYAIDEEDRIIAVDEDTGVEAWKQEGLHLRGASGAAAFSSYLAVGDSEGYLHIFAQTDGRPVGRTRISRDAITGSLFVRDGVLFGTTEKGKLFSAEVLRL